MRTPRGTTFNLSGVSDLTLNLTTSSLCGMEIVSVLSWGLTSLMHLKYVGIDIAYMLYRGKALSKWIAWRNDV